MLRVYTLLFYLALPFALLRLVWRSRNNIDYRQRFMERFGFIKPIRSNHTLWVHCVSVGETIAATPFIKALITKYPHKEIIITSTTPTGSAQVKKQFGNSVHHCYMPYDTPSFIKRFIKRAHITFCIFMETELWPNTLKICKQKSLPVMLANARLSERSMHGYLRFKKSTFNMMQCLSVVAAQSDADGKRFLKLGLPKEKLLITGNIKFDLTLPIDIHTQGKELRNNWHANDRPVFIAASTHDGEEIIILDAYQQLLKSHPNLLLILVPRHLERFDTVNTLCNAYKLKTVRHSTKETVTATTQVILGDTMGELLRLYATSDIAFVGGSLNDTGGHNLMEPAALGLPIISGPSLRNFAVMHNLLTEAQAICIVNNAEELSQNITNLIDNKPLQEQMGNAAKQVIEENKGAIAKNVEWVSQAFPKQ